MEKHLTSPEDAARFKTWLETRGGIAVWPSINLSNPDASWSTPALNEDGTPMTKPTWQAANEPERIITDIADVEVVIDKEVKRFRVGIRTGSQGMMLKVTDGGSRRIRAAVEKAGKGAYYIFDYGTQEAVILAPERIVPLADWTESEVAHA